MSECSKDMPEWEVITEKIETKVAQLIEENARLREEIAQMQERCTQLQEVINQQYTLTNNLITTNKALQEKARIQKGKSDELHSKVQQLIKTIDASISLLSQTE